MAAIDEAMQTNVGAFNLCSYHEHLLLQIGGSTNHGGCPMEMFLVDHDNERPSIYCSLETGSLSISKPCTCHRKVQLNSTSAGDQGDLEKNKKKAI
jgi:hypothetical protein